MEKERSYFAHGFIGVFIVVFVILLVIFLKFSSGNANDGTDMGIWAALILIFLIIGIVVISLFMHRGKKR